MTSCVFCKIVEGSLPSEKIYEDEHVVAFMNIMPVTKGHVLLIPKNHRENIYDMTEEEASNLFAVAPKIANILKEEFNPAGMNLLQNNGSHADQSVFHFHLHFIPRFDETDGYSSNWNPKVEEFTQDRIKEIAVQIRNRFGQE
ncbi:HIT family protein [Sporosarcina thermotolerans]|uniref:HIT family protein n=1 Tax=Sporosarcina thermotolerans TaxID=633404 RepID=A0AAW9AFG8_9BACL|nr:HIT family protein [Sporosarcina thermotolerans]MDW0118393.1 HIT family protein [Sporosarcina thermotolerans]WHT49443.1 HIT family protein [Sporosarcina thermotolerans]